MDNYINVFTNEFVTKKFKDYFVLINNNYIYKFPTTLEEFNNMNIGLDIIKNVYKTYELRNITPTIIILPFEDELIQHLNGNICENYEKYIELTINKLHGNVVLKFDNNIDKKIIDKYKLYTIEIC